MSGENQKGFTIIETTLFLGISGLLFIGLFGGLMLSIQRQRFSDSVQTTQSFLQKQFNETLNVVNNRDHNVCSPGDTATIGASECVIMGKLIEFPNIGGDEIKVYTIIGNKPLSTNPDTKLSDYNPRLARDDGNTTDFLIPWSAKVIAKKRGTIFWPDIKYIALIRSPESGATFVYGLTNSEVEPGGVIADEALDGTGWDSRRARAFFCIESADISGAIAKVNFTGSESQDGVTVKSDVSREECTDPS